MVSDQSIETTCRYCQLKFGGESFPKQNKYCNTFGKHNKEKKEGCWTDQNNAQNSYTAPKQKISSCAREEVVLTLLWCCKATGSIQWWTQWWKQWWKWLNLCFLWWTRKEERYVEWGWIFLVCHLSKSTACWKTAKLVLPYKNSKEDLKHKKSLLLMYCWCIVPSFKVVPAGKSKIKQPILIACCSWWRRSCSITTMKNREEIQLMTLAPARWPHGLLSKKKESFLSQVQSKARPSQAKFGSPWNSSTRTVSTQGWCLGPKTTWV